MEDSYMFKNLFIKIFALIFLIGISSPSQTTMAANSYNNKSYTLPVKLVNIHSDYPSH